MLHRLRSHAHAAFGQSARRLASLSVRSRLSRFGMPLQCRLKDTRLTSACSRISAGCAEEDDGEGSAEEAGHPRSAARGARLVRQGRRRQVFGHREPRLRLAQSRQGIDRTSVDFRASAFKCPSTVFRGLIANTSVHLTNVTEQVGRHTGR